MPCMRSAALLAVLGVQMPATSPTGVANQLWKWRGFDVRYQCLGDERADGWRVQMQDEEGQLRFWTPDCPPP